MTILSIFVILVKFGVMCLYLLVMFLLAQNYLTRGFWGDEAWTSLISQLPYHQMLKTTAADFHPPGYYTIIEFIYKFLAPTEINTRLASIIFYLLTLFIVYKLASYVRGHLFGVLSAVVVATNPVFFTYAFEARNYTMFAFAATGSIFFLIELSTLRHAQGLRKNLNWLLFILFTTLGVYTHYYMFFTIGAQGLYLFLFDRKIFFKIMGAYIVVGILYLPWLPFLYKQLTSVSQSYWIGSIDRHTHYEALLRILGGEHQSTIRPWLFGLSVLLLAAGIIQHVLRHKFEKPYLLIWLWAIVPFILATLPGFKIDGVKLPFRPIFFWRYLINASVPMAMVMVHAAQKFPKQVMWASVGVLIVLSLAVDAMTFASSPYGFKQVYANDVLPKIAPGDKIVTVLPSFAEVLYYHNRNNLPNEVVVLPEGLVQFSGKSLLDSYAENGVVKIDGAPSGRYFELTPGPSAAVRN